MLRSIEKPRAGEYAPYAAMYIDLLPDDGRVLEHLADQARRVESAFESASADRLIHRYAAGKWTPREVLLHIIDDERIFSYRALRFARGDTTDLPGFEQDPYVAASGANSRSVASLLEEHHAVRQGTLALFQNLPAEAFDGAGVASGARVTVRALAYHVAGHELHHLNVLRERYGIGIAR